MGALNDLMGLIPKEKRVIASVYLSRIDNFARERMQYTSMDSNHFVMDVTKIAAKCCGCLEMQLYTNDRSYNIVEARRFVYVYLVRHMGWTLQRAGAIFNKRHCAVLSSLRGFDNLFETEVTYREKYASFEYLVNEKLGIKSSILANPIKKKSNDKPSNDVSKSASDTRATPYDVLIHRTIDN